MDTSVVQTFFNEEFGELRTIRINNEIWFVAADVCKILGLSNPTVAISRLDADEKAKFRLGLSGGDTNCVNEPGLYRLIFMSHKPEAKKIQRWIFHEVLPQIRQTGSYSVSGNNYFPPELSERWAEIKERENDVKAAEVLAKAARLTSSSKFREHLLKKSYSMITNSDFVEDDTEYIDI